MTVETAMGKRSSSGNTEQTQSAKAAASATLITTFPHTGSGSSAHRRQVT